MEDNRTILLFRKYLENSLSQLEEAELWDMVAAGKYKQDILPELEQLFESHQPVTDLSPERWDEMFREIMEESSESGSTETPVIGITRSRRKWWFAAASIIILFSFGTWFYIYNKNKGGNIQGEIAHTQDIQAPQSTKARITLSDGSTVYLDSSANGQLAMQSNVKLVKLDNGKIVYQSSTDNDQQTTVFNTLSNPRGSKVIDMTLSDGSHVWLNAGSSVTYPVAFIGSERKVSITGEAYFSVTHNAKMPFKVMANGTEMQDLGTEFNVNAYPEENDIRTTLIEGSVRVVNGNNAQLLVPGQQAQVNRQGAITLNKNADAKQVLAWKNNLFYFDKADIKTIMKEIARWYDVDVVYTKEVKELFHLKTSRNTSVANIFKILEAIGGVHLEVNGTRIIVK